MSKENRNPKIQWNTNRSGLTVSDFVIRASFVIGHSSFGFQAAPPPISHECKEYALSCLQFTATAHQLERGRPADHRPARVSLALRRRVGRHRARSSIGS